VDRPAFLNSREFVMPAPNAVNLPIGLADVFAPEAIVIGLRSRTKPDAIAELVRQFVNLGYIKTEEGTAVTQSILAREKLGSTALYNGIALPHCRSSCTEKFVGVLGTEPDGIPFDAVDGEPVHSIFLLLAPLDRREELYELLGRITAIGRDKSRRLQLKGCQTVEAVHHFLRELDHR
jgi:mannitol/fructose-specific phosphotransferase system IIA component (Ntr-type)